MVAARHRRPGRRAAATARRAHVAPRRARAGLGRRVAAPPARGRERPGAGDGSIARVVRSAEAARTARRAVTGSARGGGRRAAVGSAMTTPGARATVATGPHARGATSVPPVGATRAATATPAGTTVAGPRTVRTEILETATSPVRGGPGPAAARAGTTSVAAATTGRGRGAVPVSATLVARGRVPSAGRTRGTPAPTGIATAAPGTGGTTASAMRVAATVTTGVQPVATGTAEAARTFVPADALTAGDAGVRTARGARQARGVLHVRRRARNGAPASSSRRSPRTRRWVSSAVTSADGCAG